jgi:hypothetical protein
MRMLYKPFGIIAGVVGAKVGQNVFKALWARVDESPPPRPELERAPLAKVVAASALEAATLAGVGAAADTLSRRWFHYLTGFWPGPKGSDDATDER